MPYSAPSGGAGGGVPIPSVPVPAPQEQGSSRKRNRVMQSSLELVFSYSRHQQLRYGGSAPSFIDSYSSGRTRSTPDHLPRHSFDQTGDNQDPERDVSGRWEELEAASRRPRTKGGARRESSGGAGDDAQGEDVTLADDEIIFEGEEQDEQEDEVDDQDEDEEGDEDEREDKPARTQHRRTSDEPSFFHSDPLPSSQQVPQAVSASDQVPAQAAAPAQAPSSGSASTSGRGLISLNMFSPHITPSSILGTSFGTGSSGSQTPALSNANLSFNSTVNSRNTRGGRLGGGGHTAGRRTDISHANDSEHRLRDGIGDADGEETGLLKSRQDGYGAVSEQPRKVKSRTHRHPQGQSTDGQTLFNATAVLVGIGLLSLPLAFAYAGWIGGTIMLLGFGWLTCHTAKLLSRLIRADPKLLGYTDIGVRALGRWAGAAIHVLFCLELFALGVALVVLLGDTLHVLYPNVSTTVWKIIGFVFILPTALLPLRLLSLPSLLSSVSSLLLILVLLIDGLVRPSAPGSLRHPMPTSLWPEWSDANWLGGIGLILAGFGGHAVMPSLARDMKKPENFEKVVNKAFAIATAISFVAGAAGYLMIGQTVSDEITRDLMQEKYHYPRVLNITALWMIVINPLTKFGLSSRPLNITIESILGISPASTHLHAIHEDDFEEEDRADLVNFIETEDALDADEDGGKSDHPISLAAGEGRRGSANPSSTSGPTSSSDGARRHQRNRRPSHRSVIIRGDEGGAGMESAFSYHSIVSVSPSHPDSQASRHQEVYARGAGDAARDGHDHESPQSSSVLILRLDSKKEKRKAVLRVVSRTIVTVLCVMTAVVLPGFGRVMAFLGSFSAFLICIILPLVFYLRLDHILPSRSSAGSRLTHWILVGFGVLFMLAGTIWAFIPGSGHGEIDP